MLNYKKIIIIILNVYKKVRVYYQIHFKQIKKVFLNLCKWNSYIIFEKRLKYAYNYAI